jgi:hypothetical protein
MRGVPPGAAAREQRLAGFALVFGEPGTQHVGVALVERGAPLLTPYPPGTWPWKPGAPFTAIEFEGMTVTPYVDTGRCQGKGKCGARQGYSLKATGVRAPSRGTARPLPARPP